MNQQDRAPVRAFNEWDYPLHLPGMATPLGTASHEARDFGAELRAVYREVTGRDDVPEPAAKPRIGFLP